MSVASVAQALIQYASWLQPSVAATTSTATTATATGPVDAAAAESGAAPTSTAPASGSSSVASATAAATAAPPSTVVTLQHVVVNVTSVTYRHLSIRTAAATSPPDSADSSAASASSSGAADSTTGAVASSAPTSSDSTLPAIARLGADDFTQLRARSVDVGRQTALSLDLTTRDGDTIRLDFRQLDTFSRAWVKGETNDGARVRASSTTATSQRYVSMAVNGNLSDDEKAAIDAVLQNVVDVANQFFHGDLRAAVAHLSDMNVDTNQLADVSLKMSMSRNRQLNQVAIGGGAAARVQQAAQAHSGVSRTLEYLADQQKQLIVAAKTQFDDRSAVQLVQQLLPAMIAPSSTAPTATASSVDRAADVSASDAAPAAAAGATSADSSATPGEAQTDAAAPTAAATA